MAEVRARWANDTVVRVAPAAYVGVSVAAAVVASQAAERRSDSVSSVHRVAQ